MTSRGKMLTRLALLNVDNHSTEGDSSSNQCDNRRGSEKRVKRKLSFSDTSNDYKTDGWSYKVENWDTFFENHTTDNYEISKTGMISKAAPEEIKRAVSENIDASTMITVEQEASQSKIVMECAKEQYDSNVQTNAVSLIASEITVKSHPSGSISDSSSSSSSSGSLSSSESDSSVDDSCKDKDYNPSSDEKIGSEDELIHKAAHRNIITAQKFSSRCSGIREVTNPTASLTSQDVAPLISSISKTHSSPPTTLTSNSNFSQMAPNLQSVDWVPADSSFASSIEILSPNKRGKRKRNESTWKRNLLKKARNSGKEYEIHSKNKKRVKEPRKMKPPCTTKCRLKCYEKITEDERNSVFDLYWDLGDIDKQRQFIHHCTTEIKPKYRYVREGGQRPRRHYNTAFFLNIGNRRIRVCKLFFKNTLDINDRPIRTVFEKKDKLAGAVMEEDKRGKHGNQPKMNETVRRRITDHINRIPKVESHYTRQNTTKHYIEGGRSITDIYNDYVSDCKRDNVIFCNFNYFYNVFTNEFNLSFFQPKKDQCEMCVAFENAVENDKIDLQASYDQHLTEKELSRKEKSHDKHILEGKALLAVYDLQAVMPLPKGDCSAFYYSSKLNVLNFTITNIIAKTTECYVWDESNGHRGVNELGSCVLKYIEKNIGALKDITFYSDNCSGQQKNQFMLAAYIFAIRKFGLNSITHKFLIKGHTQNEGDAVHSLIERKMKQALKTGPIYTSEGLVSLIRTAKRTGEPFSVNALSYEDFHNLKLLASDIGPLRILKNTQNQPVKFKDIKVMRVERDSLNSFFYKLSYEETEFMEAIIIRKTLKPCSNVSLKPAFTQKPHISDTKKQDLMKLIDKNLIPKVYKTFYEGL